MIFSNMKEGNMKRRTCIKKAAAVMSVMAVGITTVMAPMAVSAKTAEDMGLTLENIQANDYVLYTVNCGTPDPSVVPNPESERMGLLQSNVDQEYGEDPETGITWGRNPANEYSQPLNSGDDATDIGNSFIYMSESAQFDKYKSSLGYSFEVPTDKQRQAWQSATARQDHSSSWEHISSSMQETITDTTAGRTAVL